MKTKPKLIMCAAIFIFGCIFNVFFSTVLHNVLSGKMTALHRTGFFDCISSMVTDRKHFLLYMCLVGFSLILTVVFFLMNMRPYQSRLNEITPEIHTPAAVGQYQHGSAKWLTEKEKDRAFESFILEVDNEQI